LAKPVDGLADEEVIAAIEEVTFRRHATLPKARRYKLVAAWQGMIGITNYDFPRGTILTRDLHGDELLQQLHMRHAALEPLPA
jgi:hypothetical protein